MSAFSEGQSSKKQKHEQSGFMGQQPIRSAPTASVSMGSSRPNVTYFRCGQLGHYKSQCTQTQVTQVICFKCGQSGHHKSQCTQIQVASCGCLECGQQGHRVKDCSQRGSGLGRGRCSQQRQIQSATVQSGFRLPPPSQPVMSAQSS
ncbi:cold shock protein 1-like [Cornus florida]|uniref:cold shock protein 1-like n=1 Tax=Cornus florida TaxID=4283 RepID=UPI0028A12301|nr:cold shock protein 1-like [Cornus florida]